MSVTAIAVLAFGAVSPFGSGESAFRVGARGALAERAIREDEVLVRAGLRRPNCARVPFELSSHLVEGDDRAQGLLRLAARNLAEELDARLPDWRKLRVACVVGTSGGGMPSLERVMADRGQGRDIDPDLARRAPYFGPLSVLEPTLHTRFVRLSQVLAACASSTVALGIGCRWLALDEADLVIAGGYDALSLFIASGFEALGATTATLPAPFRVERDGMALGEGAALVALVRPSRAPNARGYILGYGAASDAVHITAPDRHAAGLIRAGATALRDAKLPARAIDLVSAHATATPFNDAAESNALDALFGTHLPEVVVHPFKAQIGHTLGAAGALEALAALGALDVGVLPAAAGTGSIEPTFRAKLLERNEPAAARACLKLSAAFGGANAALVLGREPGSFELVERSAVRLLACGKAIERFDLALVTAHARCDPGKLSRLDGFSELAVCAAASALGAFERPLPDRTALLVGTLAASLEPNELFDERRRAGRAVEPRRFPPTSPNLAAGQCSIAFGIRGPSLSVGAGLGAPFEVLRLAADFLDGGDADAVLVVFADEVGALVSDLWRAAGWPVPGHGACAAILANAGSGPVLSLEQLGTAQAEAAESCGSWRGHAPGWPTFRAALLDCTAR